MTRRTVDVVSLTTSLEQPTIDFAYASVVTIRDVADGESFSKENVWVKRPGSGEIRARDFERVLGRVATAAIPRNSQLKWGDIAGGESAR